MQDRLATLERALTAAPSTAICALFEGWSVEDYGDVYLADLAPYPHLRERLPRMPPSEVQRAYTWWEGAELMRQSVGFTRTLRRLHETWGVGPLGSATMLDYGAGWGRLSRMMLRFAPEDQIRACDAARPAVDLYNGLGFRVPADLVEPVPRSLPYAAGTFDLVWMFSVLTHLPGPAADAVMRALLPVMKPTGIIVATIRPAEFWRENPLVKGRTDPSVMIEQHRREGFAHLPHATAPNWGDTSIAVDHATEHWPDWRVLATEDNWSHQVKIVFQRR